MCAKKIESDLISHARTMRHHMTRHERHLWFDFLKGLPETVSRQKVFGNYIVDFYIASHRLIIELDGSQHFDEPGQLYDAERDTYLQSLGLTVLRYANSDIDNHFQAVCQDILNHLS